MFDYNHHIGDYASSTGHLSNEEDLAYRRLLEMYYSTELPIPLDLAQVARKIKSTEQIVIQLMKDFFDGRADGYHNHRCDVEIEIYQQRCKKNSESGKESARRRAEQNIKARQHDVNDRSTTVKRPLNQCQPYQPIPLPALPALPTTPVKDNMAVKPPTRRPRFQKPTAEEIKAYCVERKNGVDPEKFHAYYESNGWKVGKNSMKDWKAAVRTWEKNTPAKDSCRDAGPKGKYDYIG